MGETHFTNHRRQTRLAPIPAQKHINGNGAEVPQKDVRPSPIPVPRKPERRLVEKLKNSVSKIALLRKKLFVLDTSVMLHTSESVTSFADNDVMLLGVVLMQLDKHKSGPTDVARNSREVSRLIDKVFQDDPSRMEEGVSLEKVSNGKATGKLFLQVEDLSFDVPTNLINDAADREIIGAACAIKQKLARWPYESVVLVSKDRNMRIAAARLSKLTGVTIEVQDFKHDQVQFKDSDVLRPGYVELPANFFNTHKVAWKKRYRGRTVWMIRGPLCKTFVKNEFVYMYSDNPNAAKGGQKELFAAKVIAKTPWRAVLMDLYPFANGLTTVAGAHAMNLEQAFALNHGLDPRITINFILGEQGTGKTMLATAIAHELVMMSGTSDRNPPIYEIVYITKQEPVGGPGERLGFLPGDATRKIHPWTNAIDDSLDALKRVGHRNDTASKAASSGIRGPRSPKLRKKQRRQQPPNANKPALPSVEITRQPLAMIGGRTFNNAIIIPDEGQNLTPRIIKLVIGRCGFGSRVIICGNLGQIHNEYLDELSSGLATAVQDLAGCKRVAVTILKQAVRSPNARLANDRMR